MESNPNTSKEKSVNRLATGCLSLFLIKLPLVAVMILSLWWLTSWIVSMTPLGNIMKARKSIESELRLGITSYHLDVGKYPESLSVLLIDTDPSSGFRGGPYIGASKLIDPWGNEYNYQFPSEKRAKGYDLWTNGPDGISGTEDDIGNWD